ncbi:hypothetical protein P261_00362 [Lachnospiraceae bacterium TWA4]|nr:hypothetical protein P261_00362 [Lachnospiraceae bacterium TWA4]
MFAHAYIFSWKNRQFLEDPNEILAIADSNFKQDVEDAEQMIEQPLEYTRFLSIEEAMEVAKFGKEEYLLLMQCIVAHMSDKKAMDPLYIQYDGTNEQMKAILYCIYYALPYYLKKNLGITSCATSNNEKVKGLIFSVCATKALKYVSPLTKETNVLTNQYKNKIKGMGFADYVVKNLGEVNPTEYFKKLEKTAIELGDDTASDELILKISHQLIMKSDVKDYSDNELDKNLMEVLRSKSRESILIENYMVDLIREYQKRNLYLTEEGEAYLLDKFEMAKTIEFREVVKEYNTYKILTMPISDAAELIYKMGSSGQEYIEILKTTDKGCKIIEEYYHSYLLKDKEHLAWEDLKLVIEQMKTIGLETELVDDIEGLALVLYSKEIENPQCTQLAYHNYMDLMSQFTPSSRIEQCASAVKEVYWNQMSFKKFSKIPEIDYKELKVDSNSYRLFKDLRNFISDTMLENVATDNEFLVKVRKYVTKYWELISDKERKDLKDLLISRIEGKPIDQNFLKEWIEILLSVREKSQVDRLFICMEDLKTEDYEKVVMYLYDQWIKESLPKSVFKLITLIGLDNYKEKSIPIDFWLVAGKTLYENTFMIFDEYKPDLLKVDSKKVLKSSQLFRNTQSKYFNDAKDYVENRGEESKVIKKWINFIDKDSNLFSKLKNKLF